MDVKKRKIAKKDDVWKFCLLLSRLNLEVWWFTFLKWWLHAQALWLRVLPQKSKPGLAVRPPTIFLKLTNFFLPSLNFSLPSKTGSIPFGQNKNMPSISLILLTNTTWKLKTPRGIPLVWMLVQFYNTGAILTSVVSSYIIGNLPRLHRKLFHTNVLIVRAGLMGSIQFLSLFIYLRSNRNPKLSLT